MVKLRSSGDRRPAIVDRCDDDRMADRPDDPARTRAQQAGDAAEAMVAARLADAGWTVLARNVHVGRHELDLVAVDPGPPAALVVVEVRWRAGRDSGCRRKRWITESGCGCGRPRTACWTVARFRMARPCPGCRFGSTWSWWNPATASGGTIAHRHVGAFPNVTAARAPRAPGRAGPVLHSRPVRGLTRATR